MQAGLQYATPSISGAAGFCYDDGLKGSEANIRLHSYGFVVLHIYIRNAVSCFITCKNAFNPKTPTTKRNCATNLKYSLEGNRLVVNR